MIKKIAWNTFKNTRDVNTFLELKQIQDLEIQMQENEQRRTTLANCSDFIRS